MGVDQIIVFSEAAHGVEHRVGVLIEIERLGQGRIDGNRG